jgi:hypothetical protein
LGHQLQQRELKRNDTAGAALRGKQASEIKRLSPRRPEVQETLHHSREVIERFCGLGQIADGYNIAHGRSRQDLFV